MRKVIYHQENKPQITDDGVVEEIPCYLMEIPEYSFRSGKQEMKRGRYSNCIINSLRRFPVVAYVCTDKDLADYENLSESGILAGCLMFLNKVPERQKYQKKETAAPYGNLELLSYNVVEKNNKKVFACMLTTDQERNKNFWLS